MSEPTIYKRPNLYKTNAQKRYSCYKGLGIYKLPYGQNQGWTKDNIQSDVLTKYDFGDGFGFVPAVPIDKSGVSLDLISFVQNNCDKSGVSLDLISFVQYNCDKSGVSLDLISFVEV